MMIIYIMSEWRLMNTRIERISLTQLCQRNNFNRDDTEPYIYKLDGFSGNTISKTDWVRIKVDDNTTNKWDGSDWNTSAPNEYLDPLPTHTTYWVYGSEPKYEYTSTSIELTTENAGQNITIAAGKTYTVNSDLTYTGTMTIESGGTLIIVSGKTLTIDGTINNDGIIRNDDTINNNNGTINNTGIINNYSAITNSNTIDNTGSINSVQETIGGTFNGSGTFNVIPTLTNGITEIANGKTYAVTSNLEINNNFTIKVGGTLIIAGGGTLTIPNGIILVIDGDGTIVNYGTINNSHQFENRGFFYNNGTIVNDNAFSNNGGTFNNNGLFTNKGDFVTTEGISNNNGTITNNDTLGLNNISFNTGTIDNNNGTIIMGVDGILLSVQPKQNIGGSIRHEDEDVSADLPFFLFQTFSSNITNIIGSEENISQGTYTVNSNITVDSLSLGEGTILIIQSGVTLTITDTIDNGGTIIINSNGIININNVGTFNNVSVIINNGIIINSGTFNNFDGDEPIFYNFGTIKNDNTIKNNNNIINYIDNSRIDNNGTIQSIENGITGKVTITDNAINYGTFDEDLNFTESTGGSGSGNVSTALTLPTGDTQEITIASGQKYNLSNNTTYSGTIIIKDGGELTLNHDLTLETSDTNVGTIVVQNGGKLIININKTLTLNPLPGTHDGLIFGALINEGTITNNGSIVNNNIIDSIRDIDGVVSGSGVFRKILTNATTTTIESGNTYIVTNPLTYTGTLTINTGGTLIIYNYLFYTNSTINNSGTITIDGGRLFTNNNLTNTSTTSTTSTISTDNGGQHIKYTPLTDQEITITPQEGTTYIVTADLTYTNALTINDFEYQVPPLYIAPGITLTLSGSITNNSQIINLGTIKTQEGYITGSGTIVTTEDINYSEIGSIQYGTFDNDGNFTET